MSAEWRQKLNGKSWQSLYTRFFFLLALSVCGVLSFTLKRVKVFIFTFLTFDCTCLRSSVASEKMLRLISKTIYILLKDILLVALFGR
jgi:hypothetical protein